MNQTSGSGFYEDNPTYPDSDGASVPMDESTPEEQGMDSSYLGNAAEQMQKLPYAWSFLVLRNGSLVYEKYFNGSKASDSNNIHSAGKSMLSALTGIAITKGFINSADQPIFELLPDSFVFNNPDKKKITVEHLLTMTAGFSWKEDVTEYKIETKANWVQEILNLKLKNQPGQDFNYSTGVSHLLSAVLTEATGMSTCEFAHRTLFRHLQITAEHWGRDPRGYFSGGYNLYMTPRELARFGQLYLADGSWQGKQIVDGNWVASSLAEHARDGDVYGYGYMWWLRPVAGHDAMIAWGFGGQMLYLIPDLDLVVVLTTNTKDYSQDDFDGRSIVRDYVIPSVK